VKARLERRRKRAFSGIGGVGKNWRSFASSPVKLAASYEIAATTSAAPDSARTQAHASQKDCDVNRKDQNDDLPCNNGNFKRSQRNAVIDEKLSWHVNYRSRMYSIARALRAVAAALGSLRLLPSCCPRSRDTRIR